MLPIISDTNVRCCSCCCRMSTSRSLVQEGLLQGVPCPSELKLTKLPHAINSHKRITGVLWSTQDPATRYPHFPQGIFSFPSCYQLLTLPLSSGFSFSLFKRPPQIALCKTGVPLTEDAGKLTSTLSQWKATDTHGFRKDAHTWAPNWTPTVPRLSKFIL